MSVGRSNCGSGAPVAPAVQASMRPARKAMTGPPHVATAMIAPILMTSAPNYDKIGCGKYEKMDQRGRLTGYEFVWECLEVAESLIKAQAKVLGVPGQFYKPAPREISTYRWPSKLVYYRTIQSSGAVVTIVCSHIMESLSVCITLNITHSPNVNADGYAQTGATQRELMQEYPCVSDKDERDRRDWIRPSADPRREDFRGRRTVAMAMCMQRRTV